MNNPTDLEFPDARIEIAVVCENHELESGMKQLNPLVKQILQARQQTGAIKPHMPNSHFGRLTFSQK